MNCSMPESPVLHCILTSLKFSPLNLRCCLTISSSAVPFSFCLQSFPASGSFPMRDFASGGQTIGASASAFMLLVTIQDWFPSGLISLISLLSKGFSTFFSSTTVIKHQFFSAQPSFWSSSHIHPWLLWWTGTKRECPAMRGSRRLQIDDKGQSTHVSTGQCVQFPTVGTYYCYSSSRTFGRRCICGLWFQAPRQQGVFLEPQVLCTWHFSSLNFNELLGMCCA